LQKWFAKLRVIFVDEASMVSTEAWQTLTNVKLAFPHLLFCISGDFKQLEPVCDSVLQPGETYEHSNALHFLCDGNRIELTECRRGDKELFQQSVRLRKGGDIDVARFPCNDFTTKNLAYTHATRMCVNEFVQTQFCQGKECRLVQPANAFDYELRNGKREKKRITQPVQLCVGYPLVCYKTNKVLGLNNSDRFEVTALHDETFDIKRVLKKAQRDQLTAEQCAALEAERFTLRYEDRSAKKEDVGLHRLMRPGFCVTVHAAQGDTFLEKYTIFDWDHKHMRGAGRYVAFTRARTCADVQISDWSASEAEVDEVFARYAREELPLEHVL
jgi:hypothetical protein